MTKITEDPIMESAFTKITSYLLGSDIIIAIYERYALEDEWDFSDDFRMTMEEFEYLKETLEYLVVKYNHETRW